MSWPGERQRHSMSARGIMSARGDYEDAGGTYYEEPEGIFERRQQMMETKALEEFNLGNIDKAVNIKKQAFLEAESMYGPFPDVDGQSITDEEWIKDLKMSARGQETFEIRITEAREKITRERESADELAEDLFYDEPRTLTNEQSKIIRNMFSNLWPGDVIVTNQYLLIHEDNIGNWNYYAGFEYIKEDIQRLGKYHVFSRHDSERVEEVLQGLGDNI